jgi:hypothetical protein
MSALPYNADFYDDFNAEQAMAEIDAYERDRADGIIVEQPPIFGTAAHAWTEQGEQH